MIIRLVLRGARIIIISKAGVGAAWSLHCFSDLIQFRVIKKGLIISPAYLLRLSGRSRETMLFLLFTFMIVCYSDFNLLVFHAYPVPTGLKAEINNFSPLFDTNNP